jgi:EmrB/QacA subfamily drug resistance transporter
MNPRAYLIFAVVAPALAMSSIDGTIVAVGLPTILDELDTTLPVLAWTLTGYTLAQTIVMPLAGKLSNDWGNKEVFLGAVGLFTIGSVGAGVAPDVYVHIGFRIVQAIGGGAFLPVATGIVSDAFGERRQTAIGLFTSFFPLGSAIGPNIGGFIIDHASWRWIFFVNLPIGIAIILAGLFLLPASKKTMERKRLDRVGVGLFGGGMLALLYGMTHLANHPDELTALLPWVFNAVGLVLLILFWRHESRTEDPLIDLELLRSRPFFAANAYGFIFGAVFFGFFSFVPYYATIAYGLTASESGAILTPRSIATAAMSTFTSIFLIRYGYRLPMIAGAALFALSLFLLGLGLEDVVLFGLVIPNLILLGAIVVMSGFGMGISGPASQNAALDIIPEKLAIVAGLRGMIMSTGGIMGIAFITLALSQFEDQARGVEVVFTCLSFIMLICLPLVFFVPDAARQRRDAARARAVEAVTVASESGT